MAGGRGEFMSKITFICKTCRSKVTPSEGWLQCCGHMSALPSRLASASRCDKCGGVLPHSAAAEFLGPCLCHEVLSDELWEADGGYE